jgi:tRNA1(Val) A37 N6-methylase TrmN6
VPASVVELDITSSSEFWADAGLPPDSADVVLMNPPFNHPQRHQASPDQGRAVAHVASAATLSRWIHAARRILKSAGILTLIWRADGLPEVLAALDRGFGSVAILPVHGDAAAPAIRVLVRAVKGGRAPTVLHPGLMLNQTAHHAFMTRSAELAEIMAGRETLPLARL